MRGIWGGEQLRRKGGGGRESRLCLPFGGKLREVRMDGLTFGTLGVKEPAFLEQRF